MVEEEENHQLTEGRDNYLPWLLYLFTHDFVLILQVLNECGNMRFDLRRTEKKR